MCSRAYCIRCVDWKYKMHTLYMSLKGRRITTEIKGRKWVYVQSSDIDKISLVMSHSSTVRWWHCFSSFAVLVLHLCYRASSGSSWVSLKQVPLTLLINSSHTRIGVSSCWWLPVQRQCPGNPTLCPYDFEWYLVSYLHPLILDFFVLCRFRKRIDGRITLEMGRYKSLWRS